MAYSDRAVQFQALLISKWPVGYKIVACVMKIVSIMWTEREVQFWNKWNFVEQKTEVLQCVLKMQ